MSLVSPASCQPRAARACDGPLASWIALGRCGVGQPRGDRLLGRLVEGRDVEVGRVPVGRGDGQGPHVAGAPGPLADDVDAGALPLRGVLGEPGGHLGGVEHVAVDVEARLGLDGDRLEGGEEALAQHAELEAVEDLVHLLAVPALPLELVDGDAEVDVAHQLVEPAVAQDAVEVLAQRGPDLAADLVDVGDDAVAGRRRW